MALHLLDDDLGWLSRGRDGDQSSLLAMDDHDSFVAALAAKNQRWIDGAQGLSPPVITELLDWSGQRMDAYYASMDMLGDGRVSWAGDGPVPIWFDIAQDLTERWVHQMQMREALGRVEGYAARYLPVVLRTFVWAVPGGAPGSRGHGDRSWRIRSGLLRAPLSVHLELTDAEPAHLEFLDHQPLDRCPSDRQPADGHGAERRGAEGEGPHRRRSPQAGPARIEPRRAHRPEVYPVGHFSAHVESPAVEATDLLSIAQRSRPVHQRAFPQIAGRISLVANEAWRAWELRRCCWDPRGHRSHLAMPKQRTPCGR